MPWQYDPRGKWQANRRWLLWGCRLQPKDSCQCLLVLANALLVLANALLTLTIHQHIDKINEVDNIHFQQSQGRICWQTKHKRAWPLKYCKAQYEINVLDQISGPHGVARIRQFGSFYRANSIELGPHQMRSMPGPGNQRTNTQSLLIADRSITAWAQANTDFLNESLFPATPFTCYALTPLPGPGPWGEGGWASVVFGKYLCAWE